MSKCVMLAASYWSLLAPAIEMAEESGKYGHFAFFPVAVGSALGALFVYITDLMMPILVSCTIISNMHYKQENVQHAISVPPLDKIENGEVYQRCRGPSTGHTEEQDVSPSLVCICVCSRPGTASEIMSVSFRNLAVGIGIQNFPEGLAVSLPLRGSGVSTWYGQLSGMVEPLAGLLGAVAVVLAEPLLPYALAFAAGAMVYVVVDDIIPETADDHMTQCVFLSHSSILGFIFMMSLDVGLAELFHWTNLRMSADCTEKRDQSSFSSQWIGLLISGIFFYLVYFVIFLLFIFCFIWKPVSATG
uniref:Zinc transporter ZIP11 n=1 Tax=Cyprinus carpio TaxID=7962 RepID=A0A8C1SJ82_CYPCA